MIYQLAHTSPYLGGQVRLDLYMDYIQDQEGSDNIIINDIHVVPLSDEITFNEDNGRVTLNYKHNENIRHLYNLIKNDFFNDVSYMEGYKWFYSKDTFKKDTYDHTYQRGLRRLRYKRYGKQFSFLCPVWLDSVDYIDNMSFRVRVMNTQGTRMLINHPFELSEDIKNYLKEYLADVSSDLLNLNFDLNQFYVKGVEASTGTHLTKDVSYIIPNLLVRERPLMEFDSMLCDALTSNDIIAQQLINFNFIFNIEDIIPTSVLHNFYLHRWNIVVDVMVNDKVVQEKDIYNNYEFIPGWKVDDIGGSFDDSVNVLDYLEDYKVRDLTYTNKVTQPIFHWSLLDNDGYTYNFYNGFSPYVDKDNQTEGRYFNQPDMRFKDYSPSFNNLNWCNIVDLRGDINASITYMTLDRNEKNYTDIPLELGTFWVNNNKYTITEPIHNHEQRINGIWTNIVLCDGVLSLPSEYSVVRIDSDNFMVLFNQDDVFYLSFCSTNLNTSLFTAKSIIDGIDVISNDDIVMLLGALQNFLNDWVPPYKIEFTQTIVPQLVESPSPETTEIQYLKLNHDFFTYLYRYDGSIIPQFIDIETQPSSKQSVDQYTFNYVYRYKQWNDSDLYDEDVQKYNKLLNTKYLPMFPSIGYYSLEKEECIYNDYPDFYKDDYYGDVTWFDYNNLMILPYAVELNWTYIYGTPELDEKMIWALLQDRLRLSDEEMYYVSQLYDYKISFEYASITNIKDIIYNIKYTLK